MAGQSVLSSTTSVRVGARLANSGGSISGANCLEAMRSSFRRRSARSSVTGAGIIGPNFLGDRNVRLHGSIYALVAGVTVTDLRSCSLRVASRLVKPWGTKICNCVA